MHTEKLIKKVKQMANETTMRTRQPINALEIKVLQRGEQPPISTERRPSVRRSSIISAAILSGALLLQGCVTYPYPVGVYPGYGYYPVAPMLMPVYGGWWGGWGWGGWRGGWGGYGWRR